MKLKRMTAFCSALAPLAALSLLQGLACIEGGKGKGDNDPPLPMISSHPDGTSFLAGDQVQFIGEVTDPDHSLDQIELLWSVNTTDVCIQEEPEADGQSRCMITLEEDHSYISFQATDPLGESNTATLSILVSNPDNEPSDEPDSGESDTPGENSPPLVNIYHPEEGTVIPTSLAVSLFANTYDPDEAPENLSVDIRSDLEGSLPFSNFDPNPDNTGAIIGQAYLMAAGDHSITVTVEDSEGLSTSSTVNITITEE